MRSAHGRRHGIVGVEASIPTLTSPSRVGTLGLSFGRMRGLGQEGTWALTTFLDDISDILPRNLQRNNGPVSSARPSLPRGQINVSRSMIERCPGIRSFIYRHKVTPRMGSENIGANVKQSIIFSTSITIIINFGEFTVHLEDRLDEQTNRRQKILFDVRYPKL